MLMLLHCTVAPPPEISFYGTTKTLRKRISLSCRPSVTTPLAPLDCQLCSVMRSQLGMYVLLRSTSILEVMEDFIHILSLQEAMRSPRHQTSNPINKTYYTCTLHTIRQLRVLQLRHPAISSPWLGGCVIFSRTKGT